MLFWKKVWIIASGVLVASATILDVTTNSIGVVRTLRSSFVGPPMAMVKVRAVEREIGGMCIKFSFYKLPSDFNVGKISFDIVDRHGPAAIAGDMAARIKEFTVNKVLSPSVFSAETEKFEFEMNLQSERDNDAGIVDFCPTLTMMGTKGTLTLFPSFFSVGGEPIKDIKVILPDKEMSTGTGVEITLSRPKNASVRVDEKIFQLVEE